MLTHLVSNSGLHHNAWQLFFSFCCSNLASLFLQNNASLSVSEAPATTFLAVKYIFGSQWNMFSAVRNIFGREVYFQQSVEYIFSSEIYFRQSVEYVFGSRWNVFSAVSEIYFWQSVEYQKEIRAGWQRDCKHVINCRKFLHRKILPPWVHLRSSNAKRLVMVMKKVAYILYSKCI